MAEEPKPVLVRERLDVCELDRARMSLLNPALIAQKMEARTIDENAKPLLELTMKEGIETVWDRFEMQQPPCKYCEAGISCSRCTMGPCRIIPPHRIRGCLRCRCRPDRCPQPAGHDRDRCRSPFRPWPRYCRDPVPGRVRENKGLRYCRPGETAPALCGIRHCHGEERARRNSLPNSAAPCSKSTGW